MEDITNLFGENSQPEVGDITNIHTEDSLMNDFEKFFVRLMFRQMCQESEDPEKMASVILDSWQEHLMTATKVRLENLPETIRGLMEIIGVNEEEILSTLFKTTVTVREDLTRIATVVPEEK